MSDLSQLPSVDRLLAHPRLADAAEANGRGFVTDCIREELASIRTRLRDGDGNVPSEDDIAAATEARLADILRPGLRRIFNLTGTVLHTNLGRAPLAQEAIDAVAAVLGDASNLEFDVDAGKRGDRDRHMEDWICRLTGAEAATVVNNNASAVVLVLNTLARKKKVAVSRGELVEIGGAFRIPDVMRSADCKLIEVGTTNRTHLRDYATAIDEDGVRAVMKVHQSNYEIRGFTAEAPERELAKLCRDREIPYLVDLGAGSLVDLERWGLPHEPTPAETLANGADVVTFSGDKLLGGPQCGLIVGRKDLIAKIKKNPLKRALRVDKMTIAALTATLTLYANPDRVAERLPTLRLLSRDRADIRSLAERLCAPMQQALGDAADVSVVDCQSQIGSGALPEDILPSAGLALTPSGPVKSRNRAAGRLAAAFRALPVPVIGRIADGVLIFDLRCLEDETGFIDALGNIALPA